MCPPATHPALRMSFEQRARNRDAVGAVSTAAVYGALWAIGSSWSTAIREVTRLLLPEDTLDAVVAEVVAAALVTIFGVGVAFLVTAPCPSPGRACTACTRRRPPPPPSRPPGRVVIRR